MKTESNLQIKLSVSSRSAIHVEGTADYPTMCASLLCSQTCQIKIHVHTRRADGASVAHSHGRPVWLLAEA